mmetsp:Transcript_74874/g.200789  ORF Transcript_74874/g.200789 Transcript_74874/m.200789 type:complete len:572 (-) Transcript_74874:496-2211(-)
MTANVPPQLIKYLRELRPSEDTPDEFIADILVACDLDLTRSFEMLEERLSRSSWEVEKGKKKKPEVKPNNARRNHGSVYAPRDRRLGAPNGRNDFSKAGKSSNPLNGRTAGPQSKPAAAPQPPKPVEKPLPQPQPVDWVAPPPCNKWANGRPQLIVETPKVESKVVATAAEPHLDTIQTAADTSADVTGTVDENSIQPSNLSDGSFESSSHTEDTIPSDSLQESFEESKKQAEINEQPSEIEGHVSEEEVTAVENLQDLKIDEVPEQQNDSVQTQPPEQSSTEADDDGQIKAQQAAAAATAPTNHANSGYSSYGPGYNQYGPQFAAQQQRFARQDQSPPHGSKFHGPSDLSPNAPDDGRNPTHSKFPINPKVQHQQSVQGYGWQGLMGNSYGMMAPNVYSMSQQQQMQMMMAMQAYGAGMPYGSNFTGMPSYAQQQNFTAASSKANQYQLTGAKGMYNGSYSQTNTPGYSNASAAFASHGTSFVPTTGYPASYGQGNAAGYQNIAGYNMGGYGSVSARGEDYTKRTANEGYPEGAGYGMMYSGMGYEQQQQGQCSCPSVFVRHYWRFDFRV